MKTPMRKNNPYIYLFRKMRANAPSKKLLILMLSFSAISKILWLLEPLVMGKLINVVQLQWFEGRPLIRKILLGLVLLQLIAWIFHGNSRLREEKIQFGVAENYTSDMFHKVASLPMQRHNDNHSGETIDKINKSMYALREFSWNNFMYLDTIILSVGSIISLSIIRWKSTFILLFFGVICFYVIWKIDKRILIPLIEQKNKKEHRVMSTLFDFLSNIKTVITLRFEERALWSLRKKIQDVFPTFRKFTLWNEYKWFSMDMIMKIVVMTILWGYIYQQFQSGWIVLIGTMIMLYQYIDKMSEAFNNFTWQYSGIVTKKTDMETVVDIDQAYNALWKDYNVRLEDRNHIAVRKLQFTYQDKEQHQHTLQDIAIDLHLGQKIALVWESGSGKSTLLSLLRWLYDVNMVEVTIDRKQYDSLHILAHATSLIPQEPEIFEQTIRYNLCMGLDISDAKLWHVLQIACMDDVVRALPSWLDTDIKEKGVNLSGGQKQRLALARGLLMAVDSSILLLDEPTSSVDSMNEVRIHKNIFTEYAHKCIISSIHKLHLLEYFDLIYVLDQGRVVEQWSLKELQTKNWLLTKMLKEYQV